MTCRKLEKNLKTTNRKRTCAEYRKLLVLVVVVVVVVVLGAVNCNGFLLRVFVAQIR